MGKLKVLSKRGDDETLWDDPQSAAVAKQIFDNLLAKGHAAFAKTENGHEHVKTFDPSADEIIVIRPLIGG